MGRRDHRPGPNPRRARPRVRGLPERADPRQAAVWRVQDVMMDGATQNPPRNGEGDRVKRGGGGPRILRTPIKQVKRARKLRRQMSLPEVVLWKALQSRPDGLKFRKQFPIGQMTADFACLSHRVIIEVDGEWHGYGDQPERDVVRETI